jgi:uncharacterized membrane protein YbhN (UPF0104 family)
MIIDIKRTILRKSLSKFIVLIILVLSLCLLLFIPFQRNFIKNVDNSLLALFIAAAYIIYVVYETFRNYNYLYFNDESDKLVLRFFAPNFFTSKKNSIEIPKREFAGYTIQSFFMGYRENITLMRRTSKGIANYPPVSLTALNNNEKNNLLLTLEKLKQANEKGKS